MLHIFQDFLRQVCLMQEVLKGYDLQPPTSGSILEFTVFSDSLWKEEVGTSFSKSLMLNSTMSDLLKSSRRSAKWKRDS